jgi:hypothetical protein
MIPKNGNGFSDKITRQQNMLGARVAYVWLGL